MTTPIHTDPAAEAIAVEGAATRGARPSSKELGQATRVERYSYCRHLAVSRVDAADASFLDVAIRPAPGGSFDQQVDDVLHHLRGLLRDQGMGSEAVVAERVFLAEAADQVPAYAQARDRAVGQDGPRPATTWVGQAPCQPGILCQVQARVMAPSTGELRRRDLDLGPGAASATVLSLARGDRLHLCNLTDDSGRPGLPAAAQLGRIYQRADAALAAAGMDWTDAVQIWLYAENMDDCHDEVIRGQELALEARGVAALPVKTAAGATIHPPPCTVAMEVMAQSPGPSGPARRLEGPGCRAAALDHGDCLYLYLSGVAGTDEGGPVADAVADRGGDRGQARHMLESIIGLLRAAGAGPAHTVRATTYLRNAWDLATYRRIWAAMGFPAAIPHTICRAEAGRPEWLCEVELEAVVPSLRRGTDTA